MKSKKDGKARVYRNKKKTQVVHLPLRKCPANMRHFILIGDRPALAQVFYGPTD